MSSMRHLCRTFASSLLVAVPICACASGYQPYVDPTLNVTFEVPAEWTRAAPPTGVSGAVWSDESGQSTLSWYVRPAATEGFGDLNSAVKTLKEAVAVQTGATLTRAFQTTFGGVAAWVLGVNETLDGGQVREHVHILLEQGGRVGWMKLCSPRQNTTDMHRHLDRLLASIGPSTGTAK